MGPALNLKSVAGKMVLFTITHTHTGFHLALHTLQEAEVFWGLEGREGMENRGLTSVARGSGGRFSSKETIRAVKLVFAVDAPLTDAWIVRTVGSIGVCHLAHTTWEPPAGMTMLFTVELLPFIWKVTLAGLSGLTSRLLVRVMLVMTSVSTR